ncbi:alanine--tRNA ligase [Candidatus Woesearchaeota archaeon]|nr:alanine--tRNA ligase [Candidatus Woesearchaeota archaeon]
MKSSELKQKYLDFFKAKGHAVIPSAPLIPENDPTVLFTTAGMHPLVPFLLGQPHPLGKRLTDVQKCLRTDDIDEVGDKVHHTFFFMLGNWSLGDYFKKEAIEMSFEFLTKVLKLSPPHLAVTCFAGDKDAPKDDESAQAWLKQGIPKERIAFLPKKDNWWGPPGTAGPCGPDTEMFYWGSSAPPPKIFDPKNKNWVEIWNDVFIQYHKTTEGKFLPLKQKNVDTGMGLERVTALLQGFDDNYRTELFWPLIQEIEDMTGKCYDQELVSMRIIADHLRAAVFILGDERGVVPSNVGQGYILRRFIRRIIRRMKVLGVNSGSVSLTSILARKTIEMYSSEYPLLKEKKSFILEELEKEENKFKKTLEQGLKEFDKIAAQGKMISGKDAFLLFQSYGFPLEMTQELAAEKNIKVDVVGFKKEFEHHQELSRVGAEQKFKGGLSGASAETTKLHTATHILNEALRKVLKEDIKQRGSNITPERLRFDFNFERKLTEEEIGKIEAEVNRVIKEKLEVVREEMPVEKAFQSGAHGEFGAKYPSRVSVYTVGKNYSKEICMGPHVKNTVELGKFKIIQEESSAAGIRRIKAILEK